MKSRYILASALLSVLALTAVGCGSSSSDAELEAILEEAFAEMEAEMDAATAELPENANTLVELGVTFETDGYGNTVNSYLDNWANPEDVFGFETGDEGNKLIALNVTVTNNMEEASEISTLYYMLDFGGEELSEHSYYGSTAPNIDRMEVVELAPGESVTGDFLYEVPADSDASTWTLVYNADPFEFDDSYEPVRVPLQ